MLVPRARFAGPAALLDRAVVLSVRYALPLGTISVCVTLTALVLTALLALALHLPSAYATSDIVATFLATIVYDLPVSVVFVATSAFATGAAAVVVDAALNDTVVNASDGLAAALRRWRPILAIAAAFLLPAVIATAAIRDGAGILVFWHLQRLPGAALLALGLVIGVLASLVATIATIHALLRTSHRADWFFYSGAYLFKPSANVAVTALLLAAFVAVELAPWLAMIGLHLPRAVETTVYWLLRIPLRVLVWVFVVLVYRDIAARRFGTDIERDIGRVSGGEVAGG